MESEERYNMSLLTVIDTEPAIGSEVIDEYGSMWVLDTDGTWTSEHGWGFHWDEIFRYTAHVQVIP